MLQAYTLGMRASLASKARVLRGRMLPDDFFWNLLFRCDTVGEIARQLQRSRSYGPFLRGVETGGIHRSRLESLLSMVPFREAMRFRYLAGRPQRAVIEAWKKEYETDLLKRILRHLFSGDRERASLQERAAMLGPLSFPVEDLLACDALPEVLPHLEGTPYFEVLRPPLEQLDAKGGTLFPLEMAVDGFLMRRLFRAVERLQGRERSTLRRLFGARADLLNLYWCYRARRFFGMRPEEIVGRTLPYRYRLPKTTLRRLVFAPDLPSFFALLEGTWYGERLRRPTDMETGAAELVLERSMNRILREMALAVFRQGAPGVHTVMAYLLLRGFEVQDLTTIIEDVRYAFSKRMAVLFLVRPMEEVS